ncbi:MAG TPA: hypothetical protein VJJ98_13345 [Sedimentisphaerales bacterium]|nr:hypothetical protein [Sedimentisphaerales bacterium]
MTELLFTEDGGLLPEIQQVIDNALGRTRKRVFIGNEPVFILCVELQKILRHNIKPESLVPVLEEFYDRADGSLVDENNDALEWEDIHEQFLDAWAKVKYAGIVRRAIEAAKADGEPRPELGHLDPKRQFLGKVLYHRQVLEGSSKAFPFSSYQAKNVLGISSEKTAWRLLQRFCREGILDLVKKGHSGYRKANLYRYRGGKNDI